MAHKDKDAIPEEAAAGGFVQAMGNVRIPVLDAHRAWVAAQNFIDAMPDHIIRKDSARLTSLFKLYASTLKSEIERRIPEETRDVVDYLDQAVMTAEDGDLKQALGNLTIGVIEILPERGHGTAMDNRLEGIFRHTSSKNRAVLHAIDGEQGTGLLTGTVLAVAEYRNVPVHDLFYDAPEIFFSDPASIRSLRF
jgi:hypothetical protein